ncbi:class I SAM-dependent methyltransferase [Coraliomargarita sinensis]|nr:class I SAM-dependent methyltransferase [Coraliomargarita sinensis]
MPALMDSEKVKAYFEADNVVAHYADAAARLGLWVSEEKILTRLFKTDESILELGCGVGRIAIGLHELGYRNVLATDYSRPMIQRTRSLAKLLEYAIPTQVADARALKFEDEVFDGAIFGFNGLMQIPSEAGRIRALCEIYRVLRPGAWFVFTTHDRERSPYQEFWQAEYKRWVAKEQSPDLECFGDRAEQTKDGLHFMHVPTVEEMKAQLTEAGFRLEATVMRSELGEEPAEVKHFSDDCRFWVVQKL